jgi:hypothetical protein
MLYCSKGDMINMKNVKIYVGAALLVVVIVVIAIVVLATRSGGDVDSSKSNQSSAPEAELVNGGSDDSKSTNGYDPKSSDPISVYVKNYGVLSGEQVQLNADRKVTSPVEIKGYELTLYGEPSTDAKDYRLIVEQGGIGTPCDVTMLAEILETTGSQISEQECRAQAEATDNQSSGMDYVNNSLSGNIVNFNLVKLGSTEFKATFDVELIFDAPLPALSHNFSDGIGRLSPEIQLVPANYDEKLNGANNVKPRFLASLINSKEQLSLEYN